MRKHLSLFLCICLISFLFPTAALGAADETAVSAAEAFLTDSPPAVDGFFANENWYMVHEFTFSEGNGAPTGKLGAFWTADALYAAVSFEKADTLQILFGEAEVVYDISGKTFTQNTVGAEAAASAAGIELKLPFSACGVAVTEFNQKVPFHAVLSNGTDSAALTDRPSDSVITLRGSEVIWADDCDDFSAASYQVPGIAAVAPGAISMGNAPGGIGAYRFQTLDPTVADSTNSLRKAPIDFYDGPIEFTLDIDFIELPVISANFGWRGFAMQTRSDKMRGFAFNKDENGKVYCGYIASDSVNEKADTGLTVDSGRQTIKLSFDENREATLYVNGEKKHTFSQANGTVSNTGGYNTLDILISHYNRVGTDATEVELYNYSITRPLYEDPENILKTAFETLSVKEILGTNADETAVSHDLVLSNELTIPVINVPVALNWTSSNQDIIADDGTLNSKLLSGGVTMTAAATLSGVTVTKDFDVNVAFHDPEGTVGCLKHDMDPYTGVFSDFTTNEVVTLDEDYTSIGLNLKEKRTINRVILKDSDDVSRVEKRNLSLYVSDDNTEYTRIKQWDFLKQGETYYLYNFEASARYVKVHCHYDSIDNAASFKGVLQEMISAEAASDDDFIGANGSAFTGYIQYSVANTKDTEFYDYAMYIPEEDLNLPDGAYNADMSDIRFTQERGANSMLHHYYDGMGFFVRIPYIAAGGTASLRVYYGNSQAVSTASGEGTFEVEYGNKTLQDLTVRPTYTANGKVFQMPNGDLIGAGNSIGAADQFVYMRRSTDGGRTWGEPTVLIDDPLDRYESSNARNEGGSFMRDGDRVFYIYFRYVYFAEGDLSKSNCKMAIVYTDDNGYHWSEPYVVENPEHPYALSYSNGLVTSVKDGKGPNVDYVIPYGMQYNDSGSFATATIYSEDGGETWTTGRAVYKEAEGMEGGVSESAITELSDGRLLMLMRCQFPGIVNFYKAYSSDYGKTWTEPELSNIYATNTLPVLNKDNGNTMLLWAGHSTLGANSYLRFPLALAYSSDDTATWKQHLDVLANTSWSHADITENDDFMTQPDIAYSNYKGGDDAMIVWWSQGWGRPEKNHGVLIEDFHDYLYKTQGAYDSFEGSNAKNEGWLNAQLNWRGQAILSSPDKVAVSGGAATAGKQSLKLIDTAGAVVRGSRNIPSMTKGTVSFNANVSSGMNSGMFVELKAAYNPVHHKNTPIELFVLTDGTVGVRQNGTSVNTQKKVSFDEWHNFRIEFDMEAENKTAKLYVDNEFVTEFAIDMTQGNYVSCLQFSDGSSLNAVTDENYFCIDELIATKTLRNEPCLKLVQGYFVHYDGAAKTLSVTVSKDGNATAVVASYIQNENGQKQMVDVLSFDRTFTSGETTVIDVSALNTSGANLVKALLLSGLDAVTPLCGSEEIKISIK